MSKWIDFEMSFFGNFVVDRFSEIANSQNSNEESEMYGEEGASDCDKYLVEEFHYVFNNIIKIVEH